MLPPDPYEMTFFFHTDDIEKLSGLCKTPYKSSSFDTYMIYADRPDKYFVAHNIVLSRACRTKPTLTQNNICATSAYFYDTNNQWHTYAQMGCDTKAKIDKLPIHTHMRDFGYKNLEVKIAHVALKHEAFLTDNDIKLEMTRAAFHETGNAYASFQLPRSGSHTPKDREANFTCMKEFLDEAVSSGLLRPMTHILSEFPEFETMKPEQG